jgi:hypothetical protein
MTKKSDVSRIKVQIERRRLGWTLYSVLLSGLARQSVLLWGKSVGDRRRPLSGE